MDSRGTVPSVSGFGKFTTLISGIITSPKMTLEAPVTNKRRTGAKSIITINLIGNRRITLLQGQL
jgi:hypothetical protein